MILKEQKPIELHNECGAFYDESDLVNAMIWYSDKPICRSKKVSLHAKYPSVSIYHEKLHIHRLLMMYWLSGEIPDGFIVHHINGNKMDSRRENLCLYPESLHGKYHNTGKKLSESHKKKIGIANRKRRGTRYKSRKPEITSEKVYEMRTSGMSFNQISKQLGLDWGCVKQRYLDFIHDNPELIEK